MTGPGYETCKKEDVEVTRIEALVELTAKVEVGKPSPHFTWQQALELHYSLGYMAAGGSLDAAKALHEAVLPGWGWRVAECHLSDDAFVFPDFNCPKHGPRLRETVPVKFDHMDWSTYTDIDQRPAGNPARAWLLAILRALIALTLPERTKP